MIRSMSAPPERFFANCPPSGRTVRAGWLASPPKIMFAFRHKDWNGIPDLRVIVARVSRLSGKVTVASREYFACQAATLLKYANQLRIQKLRRPLLRWRPNSNPRLMARLTEAFRLRTLSHHPRGKLVGGFTPLPQTNVPPQRCGGFRSAPSVG